MLDNQNLDDLFNSARNEHTAVPIDTQADLDALVARASKSRRFVLTPMLAASAVLVLGVVVAASVIVLNNPTTTKDIKPTPVLAQLAPSAVHAEHPSNAATTPTITSGHAVRRTPTGTDTKTSRQVISWATSDDDYVHVAALLADEDIFRSLNIEPSAVSEICRNLAGADSVTNCSGGLQDAQVKVCVFRNGTPEEVVFMDRPGPVPVMFTSSNGRGRVVTSRYSSTLDPNKLVPVAAHGCGDNVLMWFSPTEEFVYSLPDSLGNDLDNVLEFDMQMNSDGKNLRIHRKFNMPDTSMYMDDCISVDSVLKSMNVHLDSLGAHIKFNMQAIQKQLGIADSVLGNRSLPKTLDSTMRKHLRLLDSLDFQMDIDNDAIDIHAKKIQLKLLPRFEKHVVVIKCGTMDRKSNVPTPSLPLQETRISDGALFNTTVYPNPTNDGGVTVGYILHAPRLVTVNLVDLTGAVVRVLAADVWKNTGAGQMAFALPGVPPGMFLVTLSTDKGERVVQRLIVQ